jgi:phosphoenolpyruvate carboxykinase (ATP)
MRELGIKPVSDSLSALGIMDGVVHWNLPSEELIEKSLALGQAELTNSGAITVDTGEFTGRSPLDRFIVTDSLTENLVWWNNINLHFEAKQFNRLFKKVIQYLNGKEIYVRDAAVCADVRYQINVRALTEYPWSNLFVHNMFLRLGKEELKSFSPEWLIVCAPGFKADPKEDGTRQHNFSIINFNRKIILIGGTAYTGEIKKGIFSALNFILPNFHQVLPMHCSANLGEGGDVALFFGLSGTGKTTLSASADRKLIGDDEHGWTPDNTIFNFEGGCYAKVINLSAQKEPEIYAAIRKGALLENVCLKIGTNEVDYDDDAKTENTRVSYPIEHINRIAIPSLGTNPKHIFFLTCDAFGVLPPISRLNAEQAAFHFISGYTAKVAGTEAGITEPTMTFSACFGAPFMPLHPTVYAEMLSKKINETNVQVWLINTGWSGGPYGEGKRINLSYTRAMIKAALDGKLDEVSFIDHEIFGVSIPEHCPEVPDEILDPAKTWQNKDAYEKRANFLANAFLKNFERFSSYANDQIISGAPRTLSKY